MKIPHFFPDPHKDTARSVSGVIHTFKMEKPKLTGFAQVPGELPERRLTSRSGSKAFPCHLSGLVYLSDSFRTQ